MSAAAAAVGYLVLGALIGAGAQYAAAWTAARARVLELEAAHQDDLDRMHRLHRYQIQSVRRDLGLDPGESWATLLERKLAEKPPRPVLVRAEGRGA